MLLQEQLLVFGNTYIEIIIKKNNNIYYDNNLLFFRSDQERTMQQVCNSVPFALKNGNYNVEVIDALEAKIFDMDIISDEFKPSAPTIVDHIWGFFTGKKNNNNKFIVQ